MRLVVSLAFALAVVGCSGGSDCRDGSGCDGDCTATGECVPAGTAVDLRITWTVDGQRPAPTNVAPCDPIAEMQIDIEDSLSGEIIEFAPVPCDIGQFTLIDLPPRIDRFRVLSFDSSGAIIGNTRGAIPSGTDVEVDVELLP